eukprot:m.161289 g.161289  ORF g.161289 m.161289 type:complete len:78 (-) comp15185_c0_seq5:1150-1383(-)
MSPKYHNSTCVIKIQAAYSWKLVTRVTNDNDPIIPITTHSKTGSNAVAATGSMLFRNRDHLKCLSYTCCKERDPERC